jgi:hypothetical protein
MMPANVKRRLWCIWGIGALGWAAVQSRLGGGAWLRTLISGPLIPLPDQNSPPGMPELPASMFYWLILDAVLPPLLVLLAGLLIGWIIASFWKRDA